MSAYVLVEIEVLDPVRYRDYMKQTPDSIAAFGGRFIVRGGDTELLEGDAAPKRIVVLEFRDLETAKAWWSSDRYRPARDLRQQTANTRMILVDGLD